MEKKNFSGKNQGQAILTIIMLMVVALTIGFAIAGQTVTDIDMSRLSEESGRAFSAAEAGLEEALSSSMGLGTGNFENASFNYKKEEIDTDEFYYPLLLKGSETAQIWLTEGEEPNFTNSYSGTAIKVGWGKLNNNWQNDEGTPALKVLVLYFDGSDYKLGKFFLDPKTDRENNFCFPNGQNCQGVSNFKTTGELIGGKTFQFSADLDLSSFTGGIKKLIFLRANLFYNTDGQYFGVKAIGASLPKQGTMIESTGRAGVTVRKVILYDLGPKSPPFLDYALFSSESIEK